MAEQFKRHYVALDMYKESSSEFEVVEGDTANLIIITLTDRGTPVDLTDCKVVVAFVRAGVPVEQDSDGHGVTISGENHNIITVDLYATSYAYGRNTAEVQVWSGEAFDRLVTSAWFNFKSRRARINEATLLSVPQWPILSGMINTLNNIVRGVQSKWSTTDVNDPTYIQDKPVIGTDIQSPTNSLTVDYSPVGTDAAPFYRLGTGHIKITLATILGYIRAQLDSYFAAISHKSRHASGGADALYPSDIGAEKERIRVLDQTIPTSGWETFTGAIGEELLIQNDQYIYRKSVPIEGVLANMTVYVIPSTDKKSCGTKINPIVIPYDGGIKIYAKAVPTTAFTFRSVDCLKAGG